MASQFQAQLEAQFDFQIDSITGITGGDINEARLLKTNQGDYFLKFNNVPHAAEMFTSEVVGLHALAASNVIRTPLIIGQGMIQNYAFLLLEYLPTEVVQDTFWEHFGKTLATFHGVAIQKEFGWKENNFIGSLAQKNTWHSTWQDFYAQERLLPQMKQSLESNSLEKSDLAALEKLIKRLPEICPTEPATLIHGDLWSGNYVAVGGEEVALIDPSVCYAHREMDIAMSQLFGGFHRDFYYHYNNIYPLEVGFEQRMPIYQLYYLLVHVNLFGTSYVPAVRRILEVFR